MAASEPESRLQGGQLNSAIASSVVRVVADYTGRGPTRAKTTIDGDWVFVTLQDALTKGERKLAESGRSEFVLESRKVVQNAMRDELRGAIERHTGRRVAAFMSDNHIEPDVGIEIFMLARSDVPESADYVAPGAPQLS